MRFKGTHTAGKNRGDVIEFMAEEKVLEAAKLALSEHFVPEGYRAYATDLRCLSFSSSPIGGLLRGKWQHNSYHAEVAGVVNRVDMAKDQLLAGRPMKFAINFEDALDKNGMPDLKIKTFSPVD